MNETATADVTTARTALAEIDETYMLTAVITTASTIGISINGVSAGHSAGTSRTGTPIESSSVTPNTVATFTAHCCHAGVGSCSCQASVPRWRSSALASDPAS